MPTPKVVRTLLLAFAVLWTGGPARAADEGDAWSWRRFGEEQGLPANEIIAVLEARSGRTWAFTPAGLAWFDGHRWWTVPNPDRAPVGRVGARCTIGEQVAFVADGRLWLAGRSGIQQVPGPDSPLAVASVARWGEDLLVELRSDVQGRGELWRANKGDWLVVEPPGELGPFPAVSDSRGGPPFLQGRELLYRWGPSGWAPHLDLGEIQGGIWVEAESGVGIGALRYPHDARGVWTWDRGQPPVRLEEEEGHWIRAADVAEDGRAVVALDSGTLRMRVRGEWFDLRRPASLGHVGAVAIRRHGDLWLGTANGLFLHELRPLWDHRALPDQHVNVLLERADGTLLVGTDEGLWTRKVAGEFERQDRLLGRRLRAITGLAEDGAGRLWLASGESFGGALSWDGEQWEAFGPDEGLRGVVHRISVDRAGRPWFCTLDPDRMNRQEGHGAFVLSDGVFEVWDRERGLRSNRVYDVAEGPHQDFWFATAGGLSRYQSGKWSHWTRAEGLHSSRVFAVEVDEAGTAWFAHQSAGGGVGALSGDELHYYTPADGLAGEHVWDLDVDPRGWVWATTQSGLSVVRDDTVGRLGPETGLPNPRLWPVLATQERVWVGTLGEGIAALRMDRVEEDLPVVEFVGDIATAAVPVVRWRALSSWGAIPLDRVRTRYRVDGGPWGPWALQRETALEDLKAGTHQIEVQALGFLGDQGVETAVQSFRVPRHFLSTRAAAALMAGLGLTALALAIVLHGRQRLAAAIRERDRLFSELVDNALDLIYTCDVDGRLTSFNPAAVEVLGYAREEAIGRPLADFVVPAHRERLADVVGRALAGEQLPTYELDVRAKVGADVALEVSTHVLRRGDGPLAVQSVARDVTRRRELEGQLLQAQKMEAVGQLAGGIAHDFNNMLLVINGYGELLLQTLPPHDPSRLRVEQILEAGERASSLTGQLLAFSRKQVLRPERLDVGALVLDMRQLLRSMLSEDIELELDVDEREQAWVLADPTQLQQVVLNLAVNARDEMPRGGKLSISARVVEDEGGGQRLVELLVSDTGRGMDEETRARLFEPFFTTKQLGKGTGLGLSTVYGIVEQSGGRIDVESQRGQGATFRIRLPRAEPRPADAPRAPAALPAEAVAPSEVVLVVEDEPEVRGWMSEVLAGEGYEVVTARDASEALQAADERHGRVHLLVTDVVMPGMSGPELARALAARRPGVKVLYVSGYTGEALLSRGGRESGVHFLQKPFRSAALLEKVRAILAAAREERQRTAVSRH